MKPAAHILYGNIYSRSTGYIAHGGLAFAGDGHIIAVGLAEQVRVYADATTQHTQYDGLILPGFCDSHQHFLSYIRGKVERVSLWEARSFADIHERLVTAQHQTPPGEWIVADGHDQGRYVEQRHPTLAELDAMVPNHPLIIHRACHHIALVNSCALSRAGIDTSTPQPTDGFIDIDDQGNLTGILAEGARALVLTHVRLPAIDWQKHIPYAVHEYHRRGITAIGEAAIGHINGLHDLRIMEDAHRSGTLRLRTSYMGYGDVAQQWLMGEALIAQDDWRNAPIIKYFLDGTLGGLSAWLSQPYRHHPHLSGFPLHDIPTFTEQIARAHHAEFQVAVHAIGDEAVATVARIYADLLAQSPNRDHRHRIEHCEVIRPDILDLMSKHQIIAAVQPLFTWYEESDVAQVPATLWAGSHAWGDIVRVHIPMAFGSDNPVVPDFNPLFGIAAAVTRQTYRGDMLHPAQALSWQTAVDAYTYGAAWSLRRERVYGDFIPGMRADATVIAGDFNHAADAQILATWVDGVCVFRT